ncbi:ASCH domain-containing protein [Spirosoma foliorum]|uniref:ASCH domain-containing protein n=1 Tax=Spirosoma foliorum TaxID=2710596 RepID=A0A7G5H2S2_9BACT|nr:ASCH domain-containing protein [Spirosoma foliorum]QMW05414.1 ASCH domain-containing protein [Spirosoma foliorum]
MTRSTNQLFISYHHELSQRGKLITVLHNNLHSNNFWSTRIEQLTQDQSIKIHLGIFVEPFLQYIFEGRKTVESRFSINKTAPYDKVNVGDVLLLKRSGGPIIGLCQISQIWSYQLTPSLFKQIQRTFSSALCVEGSDFWQRKKESQYATLMAIDEIACLDSYLYIDKRDRRGWVILG